MMFQKPRSKIGQFPCLWIGLCSAIWRHIKITFFVLTCHMSQTFLRCCESSITKSLKPLDTRVTDLTKATRSKAASFACWRKYPQSLVQWCIGCPDHSAPKALVSPQNRRKQHPFPRKDDSAKSQGCCACSRDDPHPCQVFYEVLYWHWWKGTEPNAKIVSRDQHRCCSIWLLNQPLSSIAHKESLVFAIHPLQNLSIWLTDCKQNTGKNQQRSSKHHTKMHPTHTSPAWFNTKSLRSVTPSSS